MSTAAPRGGNARAAANAAAPQSHVEAWALRTFALEADRLEALLWHAQDRLKAGLVPGFVSGFNAGFRIPPERPPRLGGPWFGS